jgi:hypothetical protein
MIALLFYECIMYFEFPSSFLIPHEHTSLNNPSTALYSFFLNNTLTSRDRNDLRRPIRAMLRTCTPCSSLIDVLVLMLMMLLMLVLLMMPMPAFFALRVQACS